MATSPPSDDTTGVAGQTTGALPGATMATEYLGQQQQLTLVNVEDLKDWKSSMREESWQFSAAGFFASGTLWLGAERLFTNGPKDGLFQICVVVLIASGAVAFFGYKQLGRRSLRIQRCISIAESNQRDTTEGTGK